jgi:hypothetical protein
MRKLAALGATLCTLATWVSSSSQSPQLTTAPTPQSIQVNELPAPARHVETVDEWVERTCLENPGVDRALPLEDCIRAKLARHRTHMDALPNRADRDF